MSILARLQTALISRPQDPFLHYAIAMEYLKAADSKVALEKFAALRSAHPNYIPTYLQYGTLLAEQDRIEEAKEVLQTGQAIANNAGDYHSAGEIAEALDRISF